jgi:hypothetical protein
MANKDFVTLQRHAETQYWNVEPTGGDHLKWTPPSGRPFYISSSTPKSQRTLTKVRVALRARGLVLDPEQYKRLWKEAEEQMALEDIPMSNSEIAAIIEVSMADRPDPFCVWHDPPKEFHSLVGAAIHRQHCKNKPKEGDEVKRDMTSPPERERLNCPLCPWYCWISQPHLMGSHLKAEHGKGECPHCNEIFTIAKGGLYRHMEACERKIAARAVEQAPTKEPLFMATLPTAPDPVVTADHRIEEYPEVEAAASAPVVPPVVPEPEPVPEPDPIPEEAPVARTPAVAAPSTPPTPRPLRAVTSDASDDDLFDLLEIVLDGPVMVTRKSLGAINAWMDATRELLKIKEES